MITVNCDAHTSTINVDAFSYVSPFSTTQFALCLLLSINPEELLSLPLQSVVASPFLQEAALPTS